MGVSRSAWPTRFNHTDKKFGSGGKGPKQKKGK